MSSSDSIVDCERAKRTLSSHEEKLRRCLRRFDRAAATPTIPIVDGVSDLFSLHVKTTLPRHRSTPRRSKRSTLVSSRHKNVTVTIKDWTFRPQRVHLERGGTIRFVVDAHEESAHKIECPDLDFQSPSLEPGTSISYQVDVSGTYGFADAVYPFMRSTVHVAPDFNQSDTSRRHALACSRKVAIAASRDATRASDLAKDYVTSFALQFAVTAAREASRCAQRTSDRVLRVVAALRERTKFKQVTPKAVDTTESSSIFYTVQFGDFDEKVRIESKRSSPDAFVTVRFGDFDEDIRIPMRT